MEFYNQTNHRYFNVINRALTHWRIKVELLDHYENTIDAIEQDLDNGNSGSIVCSNEQGAHKTCSFTLTNLDEKYTPDENNPFWFNRKFRLYIGVVDNQNEDDYSLNYDTYWFAKGVFITETVSCNSTSHLVSISGVDKYAQLDGTLNVLQADEMNTVFEQGAYVEKVVSDILMLNMGNGLPLDPIEPIIDYDIAQETLYKEYTLSAGQYYGDFLSELASSFGCNIFYDNLGRFTMRRSFTDDVAYWNAFKAPSHEFEYSQHGYMSPQETAKLNGVNKIIVQTENIETPNASYTAINHNPRSPLCYDKIGARTLPENGGIITINAGDLYQDNQTAEYMVMKRCKDYAEYRLMQETCTALEISFNCPMYPHINEGDIITVTDKQFNLDHDTFIVNSITFNFGDLTTQLQVVNTKYLNTDIDSSVDSMIHDIDVSVSVEYRIVGGTGIIPTPIVVEPNSDTFVTASGYDANNHFDTFYKDGGRYEATLWINQYNGNTYPIGFEAYNPRMDTVVFPLWENVSDREFIITINGCNEGTYDFPTIDFDNYNTTNPNKAHDVIESVKVTGTDVGNRKFYMYGRGQKNNKVTVPTNGDVTFSHALLDYSVIADMSMSVWEIGLIIKACSNLNGGVGNSVKLPDVLTDCRNLGSLQSLNYSSFTFGSGVKKISVGSLFKSCSNLATVDFNNSEDVECTFSASSSSSAQCLVDCSNLNNVHANKSIIITRQSGSYKLFFGSGSSLPNIQFNYGLSLEYAYFFSGCSTSAQRTISFGSYDDESELNITECEFLKSITAVNTSIAIKNFNVYGCDVLNFAKIKSLEIDGDLEFYSYTSKLSYFCSNAQLTNVGTVSINGITRIYDGGYFMTAFANVGTLNFKNDFAYYSDPTYGVTLQCIVGCVSLQRVNFYGEVSFNTTNTTANQIFMCGNSVLTDVYFYSETFYMPQYVTAFQGNNTNFKIHGIAGSAVETYANNRNLSFVAITEEELTEAGV